MAWVTVKEFSDHHGISERTARRWGRTGRARRTGDGYWIEDQDNIKFGIAISDVHIPNHDRRAVDAVVRMIADTQPDYIILNGDILDIESCSRHGGNASPPKLKSEARAGRKFLDRLQEAAPNASMHWVDGNHEDRVERYLEDEAPALRGVLDIAALLNLESRGVSFTKYGDELVIGDMHFTHGWFFNVHHAKNHLTKMSHAPKESHGHTHRAQSHYEGRKDGTYRAGHGTGCLCKLDAPYMKGKPTGWTHGFLVFWVQNEKTQAHNIVMDKGSFIWNGRRY